MVDPVKFSTHLVWSQIHNSKFGYCFSHRVFIAGLCTITLYCIVLRIMQVQKLLGTLQLALLLGTVDVADPLERCPSPRVTTPNLVVLGQTVRAFLQRSAGKWAPRVPPLKVTGTDTDRSNLWLRISDPYSNYEPISYRFRNEAPFRSKIAHFPIPVYLMYRYKKNKN